MGHSRYTPTGARTKLVKGRSVSLRCTVAGILGTLAALSAVSTAARAQALAQERARHPEVPWVAGEYLEYSVKFGPVPAGSGRMQVVGRDTLRGRPTWHLRFDFSGGVSWLGARVNDSYDSWLDAETLNSLRFEQRLNELGKKRNRFYEIFPERKRYRLNDEPEDRESVPDPLDDASFFFFIRTIPLEVGKSYDFNRYFDTRANPVTIRVLRRDTVDVPAGTFPAIVIQPMIKTNGIFSEGGHAEIWLSDDERRILLQMRTKLPFGSLNLYLRKMTLPPLHAAESARPRRP